MARSAVEYVAYVDDDCKLPPEWVSVAVDVIRRISPELFGVPYYAFYLDPIPAWFKDRYGSHELSQASRLLSTDEFLDGGNMIIKRSLLEQFGGFNNKFGMKGNVLGYGEETEFILRVRENFPEVKIYYEPKMRVYHLVRKEKLLLQWNMRNYFVNGRSSFHLTQMHRKSPSLIVCVIAHPIRLILLSLDLIIGFLFRNREKYPYFFNYLYEHTGSQHISKLGWWYQATLERFSKTIRKKLQEN